MNKKLDTYDTIGGYGISVTKNQSVNSLWIDGEYVDVVSNTTNLALDTVAIQQEVEMHLSTLGSSSHTKHTLLTDILTNLLKEHIQFEVISWLNEDQTPAFTCQMFFKDKIIGESSTSKE